MAYKAFLAVYSDKSEQLIAAPSFVAAAKKAEEWAETKKTALQSVSLTDRVIL